jgi:hypothetical protein
MSRRHGTEQHACCSSAAESVSSRLSDTSLYRLPPPTNSSQMEAVSEASRNSLFWTRSCAESSMTEN